MGKLSLYAFHLFLISLLFYFLGLIKLFFNPFLFNELFFYGLILDLIFLLTFFVELGIPMLFFPEKKKFRFNPILMQNLQVSVGMTAYNDEKAVGPSVKQFKELKEVVLVTVIDNNCIDNTALEAKKAGANVVKESVQGYGSACIRALKEARKTGNLICLVEGDMTFSASDLKKLTAYIENADMVLGTRTTAEIIDSDSQITWFMRYGNLFIAKLLQLRFWAKVRLTDVGCTYRIIRPEALDKIIDKLHVKGHYFSPHMILVALENNLKVIEVPVTLKKRVGESKGVGSDSFKGLITGFRMWWMILTK